MYNYGVALITELCTKKILHTPPKDVLLDRLEVGASARFRRRPGSEFWAFLPTEGVPSKPDSKGGQLSYACGS